MSDVEPFLGTTVALLHPRDLEDSYSSLLLTYKLTHSDVHEGRWKVGTDASLLWKGPRDASCGEDVESDCGSHDDSKWIMLLRTMLKHEASLIRSRTVLSAILRPAVRVGKRLYAELSVEARASIC